MIPWQNVSSVLTPFEDLTDDARAISGGDQTSAYIRTIEFAVAGQAPPEARS